MKNLFAYPQTQALVNYFYLLLAGVCLTAFTIPSAAGQTNAPLEALEPVLLLEAEELAEEIVMEAFDRKPKDPLNIDLVREAGAGQLAKGDQLSETPGSLKQVPLQEAPIPAPKRRKTSGECAYP